MPSRISPSTDDNVRAAFRKYLRDNAIKHTRARRLILDAILALRTHFEAEQLLSFLHEHEHNVGKATVYRTLHLLVECGILKEVRFEAKQAHYEQVFGEAPHDHMVCQRCGHIIEFAADEVVTLRDRIAAEHEFHVVSHRFQLTGLCRDCSTGRPDSEAGPPAPTLSSD